METRSVEISVVIPVFNSSASLEDVVLELRSVLEQLTSSWEVILVDDRSSDESWKVVSELSDMDHRVRSIRLLRNSGQHTALLVGLKASLGRHVITMDDDGQHPPQEIPRLLAELSNGPDLVFAVARDKQHSLTRNIGSLLVNASTKYLFHRPPDIRVASMKAMNRQLVNRVCEHSISRPYINGEALLYAQSPRTMRVEHRPSKQGASRYSLRRTLSLLSRIVFNYSLLPVKLLASVGLLVALGGLATATFVAVRALLIGRTVAGWTSVIILLTVLQSVVILSLIVVASYVMRTMEQVENRPAFLVSDSLN